MKEINILTNVNTCIFKDLKGTNIKEIIKQDNKSIEYSDKKIKAKYVPEYSVLNPETSSDSDSLKSNGARWVSAKIQINHRGK